MEHHVELQQVTDVTGKACCTDKTPSNISCSSAMAADGDAISVAWWNPHSVIDDYKVDIWEQVHGVVRIPSSFFSASTKHYMQRPDRR